jgi:hypothetical protein
LPDIVVIAPSPQATVTLLALPVPLSFSWTDWVAQMARVSSAKAPGWAATTTVDGPVKPAAPVLPASSVSATETAKLPAAG